MIYRIRPHQIITVRGLAFAPDGTLFAGLFCDAGEYNVCSGRMQIACGKKRNTVRTGAMLEREKIWQRFL